MMCTKYTSFIHQIPSVLRQILVILRGISTFYVCFVITGLSGSLDEETSGFGLKTKKNTRKMGQHGPVPIRTRPHVSPRSPSLKKQTQIQVQEPNTGACPRQHGAMPTRFTRDKSTVPAQGEHGAMPNPTRARADTLVRTLTCKVDQGAVPGRHGRGVGPEGLGRAGLGTTRCQCLDQSKLIIIFRI